MAKNKSGQTAFGVAVARLTEQYQPDKTRLSNDTILQFLLPRPIVFCMKARFFRNWMAKAFDKKTKGIFGGLICRTKFIDEKTQRVAANIQQILILGSGLDTRPYRMDEIKNHKVFEIDLPSVQDFKKEKIKKHFGSLPANVSYVAIDFNKQTLDEVLKEHKFDFSKPAFIIWEGVTQYITKEAVQKTFDLISRTADGSYLIFTYILESVIRQQSNINGANDLLKFFEKRNSPWLFGIEPTNLALLLKKYNLQIIEDIGASYYQNKYLRPLRRQLTTTEIERAVFAKLNRQCEKTPI